MEPQAETVPEIDLVLESYPRPDGTKGFWMQMAKSRVVYGVFIKGHRGLVSIDDPAAAEEVKIIEALELGVRLLPLFEASQIELAMSVKETEDGNGDALGSVE